MYLSLISSQSSRCPAYPWVLGGWIVLRDWGIPSGSQSSFFGSQHGSIWSFLLINFLPYTWAFTLNTKSQKIDIFKDLVDSSALSSSGDIEHSSCCLSGDKCQRIKASIRKKYYLITKYVQWPFNRNFLWLSQYIEND